MNAKGNSWTRRLGLDTGPVSVNGFVSPAYFAREVEHIFKKCWLFVGKLSDIPNPGDFFVEDIPACEASVIVVRGGDGQVRAFYNVCPHRGNLLMWEERGNCRLMSCRYHAWTFSLDGALRGINDEPNFFDVDKSTLGLKPVSLDVWNNLIFINLDPKPEESLREYLGDMADALDEFPFHEFSRTYGWSIELNTNWKIVKDAFSEMYHTPIIHRRSAGDAVISKDPRHVLTHPVFCRTFRRGGQFSCFGNSDNTVSPIQMIAQEFAAGARTVSAKELSCLNPGKSEFWSNDITSVFPYFNMVLFPDLVFMHKFVPISVDRTKWIFYVLYREPQNAAERFGQEYAKVHVRDAVLEDIATVERTYRALRTGALTHMMLSDQEALVRASHEMTQAFAGRYEDWSLRT